MSYALLILEQPWSAISTDPRQSSVRPFLEGFAAVNDMPVFYANYFDGPSFDKALEYLLDAQNLESVEKLIVYVAGHGAGARLGGDFGRAMYLGPLFKRLERYGHKKIAGLILDCCELGMNEPQLKDGVKRIRLSWLVAYNARMDWMSSMLINLNLLQHLCRVDPAALKDRDALLMAIQGAMDVFNPYHVVESLDEFDDDEEVDRTLAEAEDWDEAENNDEIEESDEADESEDDEDENEESDDDDEDEDLTLSLCQGIKICVRSALGKRPFLTEILADEEIWPALAYDEEEEEEV